MVTRIVQGVQYKLVKEGFEPIYLFIPEADWVSNMLNIGYKVESKLVGEFKVSQTEK